MPIWLSNVVHIGLGPTFKIGCVKFLCGLIREWQRCQTFSNDAVMAGQWEYLPAKGVSECRRHLIKIGSGIWGWLVEPVPIVFLAEINLRRCTFNLKVVKLILNRDFYLGEQTTSNKPCIKLIKPYVPKFFSLFNRLCGQTIVGGPKIALTSLIYGNSNFQLCNIHDCDFTDFGIWWFLIVTSTFL